MAQVHEKMIAIMREVPAIEKKDRNTHSNYNFRGIDSVYNTLQPLFAKHGLVVVPEVLESTTDSRPTSSGGTTYHCTIKMSVHVVAEDGSEIVGAVYGEGQDTQDKAYNKAMSMGLKYFMFQTFLIPTANVDGDADPQPASPPPQSHPQPTTEAQVKELGRVLTDAVLDNLITSDRRDNALLKAKSLTTAAEYQKYIEEVKNYLAKIAIERDTPKEQFEDDVPY